MTNITCDNITLSPLSNYYICRLWCLSHYWGCPLWPLLTPYRVSPIWGFCIMTFVANYDVCRLEGLSQYPMWHNMKCFKFFSLENHSTLLCKYKAHTWRGNLLWLITVYLVYLQFKILFIVLHKYTESQCYN